MEHFNLMPNEKNTDPIYVPIGGVKHVNMELCLTCDTLCMYLDIIHAIDRNQEDTMRYDYMSLKPVTYDVQLTIEYMATYIRCKSGHALTIIYPNEPNTLINDCGFMYIFPEKVAGVDNVIVNDTGHYQLLNYKVSGRVRVY